MVAAMKLLMISAFAPSVVSLNIQKASTASEMAVEASAHLSAGVASLLRMESSSPAVVDMIKSSSSHMTIREAAHHVRERHLPSEVASLVDTAAGGQGGRTTFSEESMAKARRVLNEMVEKSWEEMDDKIIQCKEFEERNRGTYDQVMTDLARLKEQITDLTRLEAESVNMINQKEQQIQDVEKQLEKETEEYKQIRADNEAEMRIRQNDLDVFTFILEFTKCADATSLVQQETRICQTENGDSTLRFGDDKLQKKFERLLTSTSRRALSSLLGDVQQQRRPPSFLQEEPEEAENLPTPPPPSDATPVEGENGPANSESAFKGCPPTPPDCGLLHDKLSLMWGDYKDKVDELQMEMNENEYEYEELKFNLNDQISILATSKGRFSMQLSEARSNLAADRSEKKEKEDQRRELDHAYHQYMEACKKRIQWILYQDMCALVVVRNAVLESSSECPASQIKDCDVDAWVPAECSVSCDDNCPDPNDPYACGGWQLITRKVVVAPDDCGLRCPSLQRNKKCNQIKCPVDCEMSEWSGWSRCTADCEGGVQGHTRSILTHPKNGGLSCNTVEESRACNTESCDRDCTLAPWTNWSPCSVGCGGGFQEKFRHVLIPTRGFGKCPRQENPERYAKQECNTHTCVGDELCVAHQDLLIAIDGSGSLREGGFNALKSFATALVEKYRGEYYGSAAMQVGIIEFGNGVIMPDDSVSPAINVQAFTSDMGVVKGAIEGMPYKKGFTNMAQAFALAETMYTAGGRQGAQSAIMVITDGKPSFQFQTNELVRQLDDKGIQRFFVVVTEDEGEALETMKRWASVPWETNLLHVPGLAVMEADQAVFAQKALTLFCPMSFSPQVKGNQETSQGFMHIKDGGFCGARGTLLARDALNDAACAALAQGAGAHAFLLGTWFRNGYCYAGQMEVTSEQYQTWSENRVNPTCPDGWTNSRIYDFYAIQPVASSTE